MQVRHHHKHAYLLVVLEITFLVLFAIFVRYAPDADAKYHPSMKAGSAHHDHHVEVAGDGGHHPTYGMFQDVHVMIFVGIGFLMTFLKRYGFSSVSYNFLIGAVSVQWAILVNGFFHLHDGYIEVSITSLLGADFVALTTLISFGVLLGKTTPTQFLMLTIIEIPIFVVNEVIGRKYIGAIDIGDSIFIHMFGAYFGLGVSFVLSRDDVSTGKEGSTKTSDLFAMIGTVFLWVYWPSFNSATAYGDAQHRAIINTYLSLAACLVAACAVSSIVDTERKFNMEHIQNSSLAGGVIIGAAADLMVQPFGAVLTGIIAGVVSVLGYHYLSPFLASRFRLHDTCGVHNLHGIPGLIAGLVGAIYCALATEEAYGFSLYQIFPHRVPENGTAEFERLHQELPGLEPAEGRTAAMQAVYQLVAIAVTLVFSIGGGAITGFILRYEKLNSLKTDDLYEDEGFWKMEGEENQCTTIQESTMLHKKTNEIA